MTKIEISEAFESTISNLEASITVLNNKKIRATLDELHIFPGQELFAIILDWKLILITALNRQMCIQMNSYCAYIRNLKFVVDDSKQLFSVLQGKKRKRF